MVPAPAAWGSCSTALFLLLVLAFAQQQLVTCRIAPGRALHQASSDAVWSNYTNEPSTFLRGPLLLSDATADSATACVQRCNEDPDCLLWSWCDAAAEDGCAVQYCNISSLDDTSNARPVGLPAGTCLLSGDPVQGRVALSFMLWAAVPWTGGRWAPQQEGQDADEAAAAAPAAQPLPEAAGNSTEGGDASLEGDLEELTALAEGLDAAIEGLSSLLEEPSSRRRLRRRALRQAPLGPEAAAPTSSAFLRGPDLAGSTTAASEDECAAACSRDERCTMWALCPPSEADGCEAYEFCDPGGNAAAAVLPAGTCLLTFDASHSSAAVDAVGSSRTAYVLMAGTGVAWSSGVLSAVANSPSAAPLPPSPEPAPSPVDVSSPPAEPSPPPAHPANTPSSDGGCPEPGKSCGGLCINVQGDRMNCGFCGMMCPIAQSCVGGLCMCPGGQRLCGTTCANILMDPFNCGSCGWSCAGGGMCMGGVCS